MANKAILAVLDASAIYAIIKDEPGNLKVRSVMAQSMVTTFNLAEIANKMILKKQASHEEAWILLRSMIHHLYPIDMDLTILATSFSAVIDSRFGISLGDKYCLALGKFLNKPIYTCDKAWKQFEKPLGVVINLIR